MDIKKNTLSKEERIHGEKRIDKLFSSGDAFICYPLRIVYLQRERSSETDISIMVSVSKKKFKRAVKRNRMKRLIKEAFRLNKYEFLDICQKNNTGLDIAFLYLKNELSDFSEIEKSIKKTIFTINGKLNKNEVDQ